MNQKMILEFLAELRSTTVKRATPSRRGLGQRVIGDGYWKTFHWASVCCSFLFTWVSGQGPYPSPVFGPPPGSFSCPWSLGTQLCLLSTLRATYSFSKEAPKAKQLLWRQITKGLLKNLVNVQLLGTLGLCQLPHLDIQGNLSHKRVNSLLPRSWSQWPRGWLQKSDCCVGMCVPDALSIQKPR